MTTQHERISTQREKFHLFSPQPFLPRTYRFPQTTSHHESHLSEHLHHCTGAHVVIFSAPINLLATSFCVSCLHDHLLHLVYTTSVTFRR